MPGYRGRGPSRSPSRCSSVRRLLALLLASLMLFATAACGERLRLRQGRRRRHGREDRRPDRLAARSAPSPRSTVDAGGEGRQAGDPGDLQGRRQPGGGEQEGDVQHLPRQGHRREEALQQHRPGHPVPGRDEREAVLQGHHRQPGRQAAGLPRRHRRHRQGRLGLRGRPAAEAEDQRHRAVRDRRALGGARGRPRRPEGQRGRRPGRRARRSSRAAARSPASTSPTAPKKAPTKLQVIPLVEGDGPRGQGRPPGDVQLLRRGLGLEQAVRLLLQPRRPGAVRCRRQGPDPGLGQGASPASSRAAAC